MHFLARAVLSLLFLGILPIASSADPGVAPVLRRYPIAGAVNIPTVTSIGITARSAFAHPDGEWGHFIVRGALSGVHSGVTRISTDRNTLIFTPIQPFCNNEKVVVELQAQLQNGKALIDTFSFTSSATFVSSPTAVRQQPKEAFSPMDVSPVTTTIDLSPTPGKVFIAISGTAAGALYELDEHGGLLNGLGVQGMNFTCQPNGELTYFDGAAGVYYGLDSNLQVIDTFKCANGYSTDAHELLLLADGGYSLLGVTLTPEDMSQYVDGGSMGATAQGNVLQTFDADHNLIFEWRGIDHFKMTDIIGQDLTRQVIDFQHANSIDLDSNGDYLVSNRNLSEVTKISGQTGAIIWRLGGKNNQFHFTNDTLGISYQHSARFLPDHHILLFDNGNFHGVQESRAVEFALDESAMTAAVAWQFHHDPPIYAEACANVERLANGNTMIGWGLQPPATPPVLSTPVLSEVTPDGRVVSEMTLPVPEFSYRSIKIPNTVQSAVEEISISASPRFSLTPTQSGYDVSFSSAKTGPGSVKLYNVLGECVATLFEGPVTDQIRTEHIDLTPLAAGSYFCEYSSPNGRMVQSFLR